ncbi:hypothetical protein N7492_002286 [Penicillium capsulatum]|uniref:2-dehydropantoate 2-reductase n=1 Tax=Penicillium capsulatum TaxID=69766 RepID=A0A9W9IL50_9EURO|nr:hypothetical protein N7492_002286 [Penicillium capsulatum]KAJ6123108.1 hypothetical protein N7512_005573 [Penicillium capsulatum]
MIPSRTIHILGLGSIGSFIAHSLRSLPNAPPVTLLAHRKGLYDELVASGGKLGLRVKEDGPLQQSDGFDAEFLGDPVSSDPIHNLIVAVKASATVAALGPIRHRLGPQSTVCLFQNGLGQLDDLNSRIFTDPATRPAYMFGIMRHGVYLRSSVEAILSGTSGTAAIGVVGNQGPSFTPSQPRYLLETLLRSPALRCESFDWADLYRMQLLKLASNCVLNPLTALLDVRNGCIDESADLLPLQRSLLTEISAVYQNLPELDDLPIDREQFSVPALEAVLRDTVEKTAQNSSSMREDMRKGRATEIEFINGWIMRRGRELGISCDANATVTQLVLAKSRLGINAAK